MTIQVSGRCLWWGSALTVGVSLRAAPGNGAPDTLPLRFMIYLHEVTPGVAAPPLSVSSRMSAVTLAALRKVRTASCLTCPAEAAGLHLVGEVAALTG